MSVADETEAEKFFVPPVLLVLPLDDTLKLWLCAPAPPMFLVVEIFPAACEWLVPATFKLEDGPALVP
jgi:hypothetical protein